MDSLEPVSETIKTTSSHRGKTLKTLQAINQRHLLTSSLGPLTPLTTNPDFPSGMDGSIQSLYNRNTPLLVAHCLKNNKIKSQADLQKEIGQTPLHFKEFQQIHDFIMNTQRQKHFLRPLTPFETICFLASTTTKNISLTYTWLQSSNLQESNRHKTFWESTLNKPITKDQWLQACVFPHKCAISVRLQETSFKILTNWYITPNKLHKWFPTIPGHCWRCNREEGTLYHIWWECDLIKPFWNQVIKIIKHITKTKIHLDAACCLISITNCTLKKYKNSLTRFLITAAKTVIPRHWRNTAAPTTKEWLEEIHLLKRYGGDQGNSTREYRKCE